MLKKYVIVIFSVIIVILCSCNTKPKYGQAEKIIVRDNNTSTIYSDIINNCRYIKLETTKECLIGGVDQVIVCGNRIYVSDSYRTKSLFVFDTTGNFIFKINHLGKGPGQYINLGTFNINIMKKLICIYDYDLIKMINYDYNGKFINERKTKYRFTSFDFYKGDTLIADVANLEYDGINQGSNILFIEPSGKVYAKEFPIDKKKKYAFIPFCNLAKYKDYYTYLPTFDNVIYNIDNKRNISPRYVFDFGKKWPTDEFFNDKQGHFFKRLKLSNFIYDLKYYETESNLFLTFRNGDILRKVVYSKISKKVVEINETGNDKTLGLHNDMYMLGKNMNEIITCIYPDRLLEEMENTNNKNIYSERYQKLCNGTKSSDNPILAFFSLKQF
jgi:hypothetical protein